jgi:glycosyltransferase involved in cell wall biosynthesis
MARCVLSERWDAMSQQNLEAISLYRWLSGTPAVLFHSAGSGEDDVGNFLPDERIYRFVNHLWHRSADEIESYHDEWRRQRPKHRLIHLSNDWSVGRRLQARGIPVVFANQNCLLDELTYTIERGGVAQFKAVYNARMAPFKRHELLSKVQSVLLVGGVIAAEDSPDYFRQVQAALPQATFTHADNNRNLSSEEVSNVINAARVGICLSAVEGAMFAATEYLLCGRPVVSTPSLGGRDTWFDPRFTRIVPPDPDAIAAAIDELIGLNISPEFIRNETLDKMARQRQEIIAAGQAIYTAEQVGRDFARDFYRAFSNKFGTWSPVHDVMKFRPV